MVYELHGKGYKVFYDLKSLEVVIYQDDIIWNASRNYKPYIKTNKQCIYFLDAKKIVHNKHYLGECERIITYFSDFYIDNELVKLEFSICIWIDNTTNELVFEWIPIDDGNVNIENVYWPEEFEFSECNREHYTVLPIQQGMLIPNTWKVELSNLGGYLGFMGTTGAYMPWYGQMKCKQGYIAICETPWDATFYANHSEKGIGTELGIRWENSLGQMRYRRIIRYSFIFDGDYNDMCKIYKKYVKHKGHFRTLKDKIRSLPNIDKLIGSMVIHKCAYLNITEGCRFYDSKNICKNTKLTRFNEISKMVGDYHSSGIEKIYLHIDGWTNDGYDNGHPDSYEPCEKAGGEKGLKELLDDLHKRSDLVAIHDQYRDYYYAAKGFSKELACKRQSGDYKEHSIWAGGKQTYLCPSFAPYFLRRNLNFLQKKGIEIDSLYIDVFTCNPADECYNQSHQVSRRECFEYRKQCIEYLFSKGIIPSSEEVADWCLDTLVTAHYAPYEFMFEKPGTPRKGIPVPLFDLVYHECIITPWFMEKTVEDDYMLYALLNGGIPYLVRESPYVGMDGMFEEFVLINDSEHIERCKVVAGLNKKVAKCEMIRHEFLEGNKQKTIYSNGVEVLVDFSNLTYKIYCPGSDL